MTTTTETPHVRTPAREEPAPELAEIVRSRGLLVRLSVTTWTGRKLDKRVTADVTASHGATGDAARVTKHLLGGKNALHNECIAAAQAARSVLYDGTLPWGNDGARLLANTNYFPFTDAIREARNRFHAAREAFLREYTRLVADAEAKLGAMYDPRDYPSEQYVRSRFSFRVTFDPIPAASDLRLDLPPDVVRHMERSITARVENTVRAAVNDGWIRLAGSVERVRDRLTEIAATAGTDASGRLHGAIFEHAVNTAATLRRLNITGDPELDRIAGEVEAAFAGLDPKTIRSDVTAMQDTAARADAILAAMQPFYTPATAEEE